MRGLGFFQLRAPAVSPFAALSQGVLLELSVAVRGHSLGQLCGLGVQRRLLGRRFVLLCCQRCKLLVQTGQLHRALLCGGRQAFQLVVLGKLTFQRVLLLHKDEILLPLDV